MAESGPVYHNFRQLARRVKVQAPITGPSLLERLLPLELIIQILQQLPVPDLIVCQRVSRTWRKTIATTTPLQIRIQCYDGQVLNGSSSTSETSDRVSRIASWTDSWATLRVAHNMITLQLEEMPWNYRSGSIFSCATLSQQGISFYHLPSIQRQIPYEHWIIPDLGFQPIFICHDYTQELVVAAENVNAADSKHLARFHLLHDKTGERHHAASVPFLELPDGILRVHVEDHDLHIYGDLLGLIVYVGHVTHLLVYNWKTATLLKHLTGDLLSHEIVFVDNRHFLVPFMPRELPGTYLAVVDCYRNGPTTGGTAEGTVDTALLRDASLLLQLPPVRRAPFIDYQAVHTMSSTGTQEGRLYPPGRPFYVDYSKRLFVLNIAIGTGFDLGVDDFKYYTLVIPAPVVLQRLESTGGARAVLPWTMWGADARFMYDALEDICSTRYLTSTRVEGRRFITVWDFASVPALLRDARDSHVGESAAHEPSMRTCIPDPDPMPDEGEIFARSGVLSGAPCRRVVSDIEIADDRIVRLYEDGLVVYGESKNEPVQVYAI